MPTYTLSEMRSLVDELNQYRNEYYNLNKPSISDSVYDHKIAQLQSMESSLNVVYSDSPTTTVGYTVVSSLPPVEHKVPLLSLDKTQNVTEVMNKMCSANYKGAVVAMQKADGLTVELRYENGTLVQGSTRGNGYLGEDITHNVKTFTNVPLTIPYTGKLVIEGEAVISRDQFELINSSLPKDCEPYKTPRNLASGTIRQLNSQICASRKVGFYAWHVQQGLEDVSEYCEYFQDNNSRSCQLQALRELGFTTVEHIVISAHSIRVLSDYEYAIATLQDRSAQLNFPIDGIVFKYDDLSYSERLGATSHHKNDGIAFKFEDEKVTTVLRDVEWSLGRTGVLTPVAVFDTVELDGTDVCRASLHNISIAQSLKLGIGDVVTVIKANMIIPQIVDNITKSNTLIVPTTCPHCGGPTVIKTSVDNSTQETVSVLYCENPECMQKQIKQISYFGVKNALNIVGLSESTITTLVENKIISDIHDLINLYTQKDRLLTLDGFGVVKCKKLLEAIRTSINNVKTSNLLVGLSIPGIGETTAKLISDAYDNKFFDFIHDIEEHPTTHKLYTLPNIGPITAEAVTHWVTTQYHPMCDKWIDQLTFVDTPTTSSAVNTNTRFFGKVVVVTGTVGELSRTDIQSLLTSLGAKSGSGVSNKTDYLIVGTKPGGTKLTQAQSCGTPIITGDDFLQEVGEYCNVSKEVVGTSNECTVSSSTQLTRSSRSTTSTKEEQTIDKTPKLF